MTGYCNRCHQLLEPGKYKILRGAKICEACLEKEKKEKEIKKERALQNDKELQSLYSFLLSLFPVGTIPESWIQSIELMRKKGIDISTILTTLKYCIEIGRPISENNWTILIYLYYLEALRIQQEKNKIVEKNEAFNISSESKKIRVPSTTYRDAPNYRIEDL